MFTFVLDFQGGTYVGQAEGPLETALANWLLSLELDRLSRNELQTLRDSIVMDNRVHVEGLKNVWCSTGLVDEKIAIVHIIATETK